MRWALGMAFVAGLLAACAASSRAQHDDQRVAELEARIARLEARLGGRDASASASEDAGTGSGDRLPNPYLAARSVQEAGADEQPEASCLRDVEQKCRRAGMSVKTIPAGDGSIVWTKRELPARAEDTAAGRACLKNGRADCQRRAATEREQDALFDWIDAQLASNALDRSFSARVEERIRREERLKPGQVSVACTAQICRLSSATGLFDGGALDGYSLSSHVSALDSPQGGGRSITSHRGAIYVTRAGYDFPRAATK